MATISLKINDDSLMEMKKISNIYKISVSEFVRKAVEKEIEREQNNFFYRLNNVEFCDKEEEEEIGKILKNLTDDDLEIVERRKIKIW